MCLYVTKNAKIQIAEKDIFVYKEITKSNRSSFQGFQYHPHTLYTGRTIRIEIYAPRVRAGFYSFITLEDAKTDPYIGEKIVSFVIPKGTRYIQGTFGDAKINCYVSEAIRSGSLNRYR